MNAWDRIRQEYNKGDSPIRKIIIINVTVFIAAAIIGSLAHLYNAQADQLFKPLYMPSWYSEFFRRPWTIVTYMFFHDGIMHLLFNMLFLYFIGRILIDFVSNKRFYSIYFGGGIAGGILYLVAYNMFPVFTQQETWAIMRGASGAVVAVIVAAAVLVPNYELFLFGVFRVKLKWIALFLVAMNIAIFPKGNEGGILAHLGGALFGALYILQIQGRLPINLDRLKNIRNPLKPRYQVLDETKIHRTKKAPKPGVSKTNKAFNIGTSGRPGQEEIDAILDKISQSGYDSLSKEEKEKLFRASE